MKRLKIRDLYDVFFLLSYVKDRKKVTNKVTNKINLLLKKYKEPEDEQELKNLIIVGAIPTKETILSYIKKWEK